ncbi:hypothetical protein DLM77_12415 [Leptospira yasudae]|uniref:Uncharacterized protein n=1 Tax=Leptospira yasudae TaxID=2202201 RepID=A0ABX9M2N3_9LEPT|nr:hypothetical protein DLM77_12415 [Leptospira yasudae]
MTLLGLDDGTGDPCGNPNRLRRVKQGATRYIPLIAKHGHCGRRSSRFFRILQFLFLLNYKLKLR